MKTFFTRFTNRLLCRSFGSKNRKFQACSNCGLKDNHWLLYSVSTDSVFCAYCCLFTCSDSKEKAFSSSPVSDWKNLLSLVKRHENLAQQRGCVVAGEEFLLTKEGKGESVASMISSSYKKDVTVNRHVLKKDHRGDFIVWRTEYTYQRAR